MMISNNITLVINYYNIRCQIHCNRAGHKMRMRRLLPCILSVLSIVTQSYAVTEAGSNCTKTY